MGKRRQILGRTAGQDLAGRALLQEKIEEADIGGKWKLEPVLTAWIFFFFYQVLCWAGHPWCALHAESDINCTAQCWSLLRGQTHSAPLGSLALLSLPQDSQSTVAIPCWVPVISNSRALGTVSPFLYFIFSLFGKRWWNMANTEKKLSEISNFLFSLQHCLSI